MRDNYIKIKDVLEIIFITTNKKANILADIYLIKDPSIISKWKSNKVIPTENDLLIIVNFAINESTDSQRKIMRERLKKLIIESNINDDLKNSILGIDDFKLFLSEVLNVCASVRLHNTNYESVGSVKETDYPACKSDVKTITAFSENTAERYSGVLEFDMLLSKDGDTGYVGKISESEIFIRKGSELVKNRNLLRKMYSKAKSKSFISTIIIGIISTFFVIQIANSQISSSSSTINDDRQNDTFPYEENLISSYWERVDKIDTITENQLASDQQQLLEEESKEKNINEETTKHDILQEEENIEEIIQKKTQSDIQKNETVSSGESKSDKIEIKRDNIEENTNIITNINGDRNINVIGDNIYIHME